MNRSISFDCVTLRERNHAVATIGGRMAQAARVKKQRTLSRELLAKHFGAPPGLFYTPAGAAPSYTEPNRITVVLTRVGPGELDDDGPSDALKNCRDGVQDWLGINDRSGAWTREARQEKTPRGTPWRVRIEVTDLSPGEDRRVVLASVPDLKKAKGKPHRAKNAQRPKGAGDPGEEQVAAHLADCTTCGAVVPNQCKGIHGVPLVFGVHAARAKAAGLTGLLMRRIERTETEIDAMLKGSKPRRIVPDAQTKLARAYLRVPFEQQVCRSCHRLAREMLRRDLRGSQALCAVCKGRGYTGHKLVIESRIDGMSPPARWLLEVPAEHQARWGLAVTLYPRRMSAKGLGTILVFEERGSK